MAVATHISYTLRLSLVILAACPGFFEENKCWKTKIIAEVNYSYQCTVVGIIKLPEVFEFWLGQGAL